MDPVNMIFTFFINLGAVVVYTVIVNSMAEFQYNLNLEEEKKQLEIENLCFENMKKQMESTRRASRFEASYEGCSHNGRKQ